MGKITTYLGIGVSAWFGICNACLANPLPETHAVNGGLTIIPFNSKQFTSPFNKCTS